jgi:CBS domain-containing protein
MLLVKHIMEDARQRLAVLSCTSSLFDAARILENPETPLAVVCDTEGVAVGVVSKSDIIRVFSRAGGAACGFDAEAVMTKSAFHCHAEQTLQSVWETMNGRCLRCAPILDKAWKPQGVVHARDVARALFDEVSSEESSLRDYVLGIGYQ